MKLEWFLIAAVSLPGIDHASAQGSTTTLRLDTIAENQDVHWIVGEVRAGAMVTAHPVFGQTSYGNVAGFTIPFRDNDGYWVARATFTLPSNAQNPTLTIQTLGVDDRTEVALNRQFITDSGTTFAGNGYMTLKDGGANKPHVFSYASGPQNLVITTGFVAGLNKLQVIVNNTNNGILGFPVQVNSFSPSTFGMTGTVSYTLPTP